MFVYVNNIKQNLLNLLSVCHVCVCVFDQAAYREPCAQCADVNWAISQEGSFYCRSCHNVIEVNNNKHQVVPWGPAAPLNKSAVTMATGFLQLQLVLINSTCRRRSCGSVTAASLTSLVVSSENQAGGGPHPQPGLQQSHHPQQRSKDQEDGSVLFFSLKPLSGSAS